jgi:hypothetical protein
LVSLRSGNLSQLLTRLLPHAHSSLPAGRNQPSEPLVMPLAGYENMIEATTAGAERFFDRVNAIENIHKEIVRAPRRVKLHCKWCNVYHCRHALTFSGGLAASFIV